jgi:hypothetical protein
MKGLALSLIVLVALGFGLSGYLFLENTRLQTQIVGLQSTISEYEGRIAELQDERSKLEGQVGELQALRSELERQLMDLQEDYNELVEVHNNLIYKYNALVDDYNELLYRWKKRERLRIGSSLAAFYDAVRCDEGLAGIRTPWEDEDDQVDFAVKLALHALGRETWTKREDSYFAVVGNHSYEDAWRLLETALDIVGIEPQDTPTEKVEKILAFTSSYIHYQREGEDVYYAPVETLTVRSGDCDDYAILAAALFEAVGIEAAIGLYENATGARHYMILIHLDDLEGYAYYYHEDLTAWGLQPGRWIKIEPQTPIQEQGDEEWFPQWILIAVKEVQ